MRPRHHESYLRGYVAGYWEGHAYGVQEALGVDLSSPLGCPDPDSDPTLEAESTGADFGHWFGPADAGPVTSPPPPPTPDAEVDVAPDSDAHAVPGADPGPEADAASWGADFDRADGPNRFAGPPGAALPPPSPTAAADPDPDPDSAGVKRGMVLVLRALSDEFHARDMPMLAAEMEQKAHALSVSQLEQLP